MDNLRLILIVGLVGVVFMIYAAWDQDYGPTAAARYSDVTELKNGDAPVRTMKDNTSVPVDGPGSSVFDSSTPAVRSPFKGAGTALITVSTDLVRAEISLVGGTIENLWLLNFSPTAEQLDQEFQLLKAEQPNLFVVQSGLIGYNELALPNHESSFSSAKKSYTLEEGQDNLIVPIRWKSSDGIEVEKTFVFSRGSYVIRLEQIIHNNALSDAQASSYQQLQRTEYIDPTMTRFGRAYIGAAYYSPDAKYQKVTFKDMEDSPLSADINGGWIAQIQHYFLGAIIPGSKSIERIYSKVVREPGQAPRYIIGQYSQAVTIAPGGDYTFSDEAFIGPKISADLSATAPGLNLTIDYGWLTIIADPMHWLLSKIHWILGNWGWSIIVLTILIKLAFYKLSEASYVSMAQMRKFTPRMKALKDRYGDDKERLNQAMMELYKKEKINPLGGCLPILVQIPVFIALYYVLQQSVELRHAPFMLWLNNLTAPDPYYVLPLLMGASMFIQQKLNPPPPDPMQEKVMMALPVVFTVFFAFFPSGLVLYWTTNNILSIAQQWHITRNIEKIEKSRSAN